MEVQALQKEIQTAFHQTLIGTVERVLCAGRSKKDPAVFAGRNEGNQVVNFRADGDCRRPVRRRRNHVRGPYSLGVRYPASGRPRNGPKRSDRSNRKNRLGLEAGFSKRSLRATRYSRCTATVTPATTIATMLMSLMRMFRLGPDVSLNGSPTVSPMTAALWAGEPLPP